MDQFISEPIIVDVSSMSTSQLARGGPACPMRFTWRDKEYNVIRIVEQGKQLRAHDSSEKYVKSHSFRVLTDADVEMVLRCDRQIRGNPWRVHTIKK